MSSSSSSSCRRNAIVRARPEPTPPCWCRTEQLIPSKERVSWTGKHPARRFYNCALSPVSPMACKFFNWKDPELGEEYDYYKNLLVEMKVKLDARPDYAKIERLENKVNKLETKHQANKAEIQKLKDELKMLIAQAQKCKKKLVWTWLAMMAVVCVVVAWYVMV